MHFSLFYGMGLSSSIGGLFLKKTFILPSLLSPYRGICYFRHFSFWLIFSIFYLYDNTMNDWELSGIYFLLDTEDSFSYTELHLSSVMSDHFLFTYTFFKSNSGVLSPPNYLSIVFDLLNTSLAVFFFRFLLFEISEFWFCLDPSWSSFTAKVAALHLCPPMHLH